MKRLNTININTPELVNNIFKDRWKGDVHYIDMPRFEALAKHFKGGTYLDVGCFNSPFPYKLTQIFPTAQIFAVDHANEVIDAMQERYPEVNYECADFRQGLNFKDNFFDYIVVGEVIEHLEDPKALIEECKRVLKPGGILAISTPLNEHFGQPLISTEHVWSYTEEDLRGFFKPEEVVGYELYKDSVIVQIIYGTKS